MNKYLRLFRYDWPMHFVLLITNWLPDNVFFVRLRGGMARPFFKKCGPKLGLGRNIVFYNPSQIEIGRDVYIAYGCWFSASNGVKIEDEVIFGPHNVVATSNHTRLKGSFRWGKPKGGTVTFEKGCWVGGNCAVLAGSTVGHGSVVAANTTVSGNVPANVVFAGNPGVVKKEYTDNNE